MDVIEHEKSYVIRARPTRDDKSCPLCGSNRITKHGADPQLVHDLPCHGKHLIIAVEKQRYRCRICRKTWFIQLPEVDGQHSATLRLVCYVQRHSLIRTFVQLAAETGISERSVRRLFDEYVAALEQARQVQTPRVLGLDEIHLMGHSRAVFTDPEKRRIIDVLPDRKKQSVVRWLARLPNQEVSVAVIDMHAPYLDALRTLLPNACVVIDKWHVLKQINAVVETVRKQTRAQLSDRQVRQLMHDRFLLLKRHRDLTDRELLILDGWLLQFQKLSAVYWRKEEFFQIYDAKSEEEAWERYMAWYDQVRESGCYDAFLDFFLTMETWGTYVFNYFRQRYTGSFVEGANSLIRSVDRAGRGYSFAVLRARMLYGESLCRRAKREPQTSAPGFAGRRDDCSRQISPHRGL